MLHLEAWIQQWKGLKNTKMILPFPLLSFLSSDRSTEIPPALTSRTKEGAEAGRCPKTASGSSKNFEFLLWSFAFMYVFFRLFTFVLHWSVSLWYPLLCNFCATFSKTLCLSSQFSLYFFVAPHYYLCPCFTFTLWSSMTRTCHRFPAALWIA